MINEREKASSKEFNSLVGIKRRGIIILVMVGVFSGLFLLGILHYQDIYEKNNIRLNPSPPEKDSKFEVYVPKDLEDCMVELGKVLPSKIIRKIKEGKELDVIQFHENLGRWMRNYWGLWQGSRLKDYFQSTGVHHPDDMSSIILVSFHRHLHDKEIGLSRQVKIYKKFQEVMTKYMEKVKSRKKVEENGEEENIIKIEVVELLKEFGSYLEQDSSINAKEHFILEEIEKRIENQEKMK